MTSFPSFRSLRQAILLTTLFATCAVANAGAESVTIDPDTMPVVLAAVEKLETIYGVPITYEDTKNGRRTSLILKYDPPTPDAPLEVRKKLAGVALGKAIQNYNSEQGAKIFTLTESDKGFHVVARKFRGFLGFAEELHPLLETPITITPGTRTILQVITEICDQTPTLTLGPLPLNLFTQNKTTLTATNEPARSVLDRLMGEVPVWAQKQVGPGQYQHTAEGGYMSWTLRTDPNPKWGSALNFHMVKPPGAT